MAELEALAPLRACHGAAVEAIGALENAMEAARPLCPERADADTLPQLFLEAAEPAWNWM